MTCWRFSPARSWLNWPAEAGTGFPCSAAVAASLRTSACRLLSAGLALFLMVIVIQAAVAPARAENWRANLYNEGLPSHLVAVDKNRQTFLFFEKKSPLKLKYSFPCVTGQLAGDKQELNDLRELIFALTNDAGEEKPSQKPNTVFPYHTQKKHVVFGGHPTWLKAIKPMLPDVKFIEGVPSSEQIKGAEMVWLQTNYMSHKAFYKIIDIVRSKNIPLRYFTSASATKGAEQVVVADSGK